MFDFIWVALLWFFAAAGTSQMKEMTSKITVEFSPLRAGQEASLTCTFRGLCSASVENVTWTWICAGGKDACVKGKISEIKTVNLTGTSYISTVNFTISAEQLGAQVTCNVNFSGGATAQKTKTLSVSKFLKISNTSASEWESDVLICACISEGFPLPTIKWPLLENCTNYSVVTTMLNNTVKSTITMSMKSESKITFECVSNNGDDKQRPNLTNREAQQKDLFSEFLGIIQKLEIIITLFIGFVLGIIFTSCITCLARICRRQKLKPGRMMKDLEMVNTLSVQKYVGEAAEEGFSDQEEAEVGVEPAGLSAAEGDVRPKEVEYSHIDFSMLKTKNPEEELTKESTESEYAEIKKETREEGEGNEGERMDESKEMRKDEENEDCIPAEEEGEEEAALYSNLKKKVMNEV